MINKIHNTINSLLKKHYTVQLYNDTQFSIILSFYHLNSVYNGLCYIDKDNGKIYIDFQYHRYNKTVHQQLNVLCENIYKMYKMHQLELIFEILENYSKQADEIYNKNYSIKRFITA